MSATVTETFALPVMEAFYTLQGEGYHQGRAAYFVRLGGCDVGCTWCDVKESWDPSVHPLQSVHEIVAAAKQAIEQKADKDPGNNQKRLVENIVVVTGGEPLLHDCTALTDALARAGFRTHLETSGSSPLSGQWDWICFSPKKFKAPLPEIFEAASELKVVVYNQSDLKWAEQQAMRVTPTCRLFLQPEWSKSRVVTPLIIEYIRQHPEWEFSLQLHKYIHVP